MIHPRVLRQILQYTPPKIISPHENHSLQWPYPRRIFPLPSGELTFCHGKIHHAINGKIHYFYGHFQLQTVSSPGRVILHGFADSPGIPWFNS